MSSGRRLQDHLELVKLLHAVRVLAVAPVGRAPRRLDEGDVPRLGPDRAQERRRVVGARADLRVVRLDDEAAALRPEALQREDEVLEVHGGPCLTRNFGSGAWGVRTSDRRRSEDCLLGVDEQPAHPGRQIENGDAVERDVPRMPIAQAKPHHQRDHAAAEIPEHVHRAAHHTGVRSSDVDGHRPRRGYAEGRQHRGDREQGR